MCKKMSLEWIDRVLWKNRKTWPGEHSCLGPSILGPPKPRNSTNNHQTSAKHRQNPAKHRNRSTKHHQHSATHRQHPAKNAPTSRDNSANNRFRPPFFRECFRMRASIAVRAFAGLCFA